MRIYEYPIDISRVPGIYGPNVFTIAMHKNAKIISTHWYKNNTILIDAIVEDDDFDEQESTLKAHEIHVYGLGQEITHEKNKKFIGRVSTNIGKGPWFIFENKKDSQ